MSASFYADLPAHERFGDLAEPAHYADVPPDWWVVLTDVKGSTAAVAEGRYRAVNFAGAASIIALLNSTGAELPFVFGGDGATLLVPPEVEPAVRPVLRRVQAVVKEDLDLTLRAGLVPARALYDAGARLAVLKHAVSPNYAQAMFTGGGLTLAERWVKDPATAARYEVGEGPVLDDPERQLFNGLECRWEEVPHPEGEIATWIIAARAPAEADRLALYREVLGAVEAVYGLDEAVHPIALQAMRLHRRRDALSLEASIRAPREGRAAYRRKAWLQTRLGALLMRLGLKTQETDWTLYPGYLRAATDYRKFDDVLRMVLGGTPAQHAAFEAFLDGQQREGALGYGRHVSERATLTCLVFNRMGRQVHFVDGSGGGYTSAARQLKARLAG
ncbi:MAG TPA: DUF3095 domain-containing protein [Rubricoccaceae bacterium]|nr:DUF3095 domain-containing protein [Rubricoccaceae bacterium]